MCVCVCVCMRVCICTAYTNKDISLEIYQQSKDETEYQIHVLGSTSVIFTLQVPTDIMCLLICVRSSLGGNALSLVLLVHYLPS